MLHAARFVPALAGFLILVPMLVGPGDPTENICRIAPTWLSQQCVALGGLALFISLAAAALIGLTLLSLLRWQRGRPRAITYESDAGRWIVLGWILVVGGAVSLLAGMLLIGSNGWPFSEQSRHVAIRTGQLPIFISTVQRRYFASYFGADGMHALCAGFGEVTIQNRSRSRKLTLDLGLVITPHHSSRATPQTAMPTREELAAIARRGLSAQTIFQNPVTLQPRERLRRELVFVIRHTDMHLSDRDHDFALAVSDRASGQSVSFALPAEYRG